MAKLLVRTKKIISNIEKLSDYLEKNNITWSLTAKVLSGHKEILKPILKSSTVKKTHSVADSRLSNLKNIRELAPDIKTMYIKPPAIQNIKTVIDVADFSLNTSLNTLEALNEEAKRQKKLHKVIIMIEMGELREGVMRDELINFYSQCFELSNIEVVGIGTNLGCMYGVEPTFDKLIQLSLYKQLIEAKFDRKIDLISGGSSITLPLISRKKIPKLVNHFRIGEAAFLGLTPLTGKKFRNLSTEAFEFDANIIEMEQKESKPDGKLSEGNVGHAAEAKNSAISYKAILDFGALDVNTDDIKPKDKNVRFFGTTSDMTVYDLGTSVLQKKFDVGSIIRFKPNYMAVARLMNSKFIEKEIS
ncbi:MAG: alanine racemase [Candidatus Cloacimonetes bacterium]|nr:alanine racemase [Candidatus Cloacimonadota bacterium]MCF7813134.1 alanine racemase [Candidatus Cloacimonadota bacterium]MCF7867582.1 alanine racemase [Candidatus Cloacimonadota bacterium]MCF7883143.1 alanine racemase [Candidatus Cloacimonadota bacterium]